jgi:oligoribonuclease
MEKLVFVDVETTGLDPKKNDLLEIAVRVVSPEGDTLDEFHAVLNPGPTVYANADLIALQMHVHNGLLAESFLSTNGREAIDAELCRFFLGNGIAGEKIAGSSVHFDLEWVEEWFPSARKFLHVRQIFDVSSLRALWKPEKVSVDKGFKHRARGDIERDVQYYKQFLSHCRFPVEPEVPF